MRQSSKGENSSTTARWLEVIADPVRLSILRTLSQVETATASDLAASGQASSQTLRRHLDALASLGVIKEHAPRSDGETPGRPAARFSLSAETRASVRSVLAPPDPGPESDAEPEAQVSSAPALVSTSSIAAAGPMNGASAT